VLLTVAFRKPPCDKFATVIFKRRSEPLSQMPEESPAVGRGDGRKTETPETAKADAAALQRGPGVVGERVSAILEAAEAAAEQIRADALKEAAGMRQRAETEASARNQQTSSEAQRLLAEAQKQAAARTDEANEEAQRLRAEADAYARDTRQAVDSYAAKYRRESEEKAAVTVQRAEEQARSVRESAKDVARQIEDAARQRQTLLRDEARAVEAKLQRALNGLRQVTTELQTLVEPAAQERQPESMPDALEAERRRKAQQARKAPAQ
jgi:hypothetical protein